MFNKNKKIIIYYILIFKNFMEKNRTEKRQKILLALYSIKHNTEKVLFGSWPIYIGKKYIIGRGKDCDISIHSLLLSRKQIELIYYTNDLIIVKDLGSRNGTFINNVRMNSHQDIKFTSKDRLSFGNENNVIEFLEYQEKRKSIFDDKAENGNTDIKNFQNRNTFTNINDSGKGDENIDINREKESQFKPRMSSEPKKNPNYLNISSDSIDTEIRKKTNVSKNDNNYSTIKKNPNYSRDYLNNRYRKKSPVSGNYYKSNNNVNYTKNYDDNNNKNTGNRFIGKKYGRNINKRYDNRYDNRNNNRFYNRYNNRYINRNNNRYDNRYDNGMKKRNYNNYRNTFNENLNRKNDTLKYNNEYKEDEKYKQEKDKFENELIGLLSRKENKKDEILIKENSKNDLELVMPIKEKDLMNLKKFKKTKIFVKGYLDLDN